ncbi:MAG: OmpH family outer membrane protein [Bacteroidaceae bacterium]|jgi:outer membrane protein|nr:OmpH family outer membrane protein [Bacteroidaceae bacterium]MBQ5817456.1 OmpH family outer membrane protein [Bacteroidaceae bacterium]
MRKYLFLLLMLPMAVAAQTNTFGYFRYKKVVEQLPEYSQVCNDYEALKKQCDAEIARNEEQLTRSYVAYLDGQNEFPEPILRKRQKELQELVDKSILFRKELQAWLTAAHDSLYAPLRAKVDDAVSRVCLHNNLAYIIDLDEAGYKFINPTCGFDITNALLGTLGIIVPEQETPAEGEQTTEGEEQQTQTQTQTQQTVVEEGNVVKEGE